MVLLFKILTLAFLLPLTTAYPAAAPHPFYVAVTEINQNAAAKTLEVSCRFFADDFEHTLQAASKTPLDILSGKDKAALDRVIPAYIGRHLQLSADSRPVKLTYLGYEVEKEAVFCYFEVQNLPTVKQLTIVNTLLHDFKPEQINILHVTVGGRRQSTRLNYPASRASFQF